MFVNIANKTLNLTIRGCRKLSTNKVKIKLQENSKANAWQVHSYGGIDELQYGPIRIPQIRCSDEVLINVEATSVNPIDLFMLGSVINFTKYIKIISHCYCKGVMGRHYSKFPEILKWNYP
jgi:hypothetical protein